LKFKKIYSMKIFKAKYKKGALKRISLVENPAIEADFIKLSEQEQEHEIVFTFSDESKREILTPVLIPEKLIYRKLDTQPEPFYMTFDAATIKDIAYEIFEKPLTFNAEHGERILEGIKVQQAFLSDHDTNIAPKQFAKLPSGTLFMVLKIEDDNIWAEIERGEFKGVSIEALLGLEDTLQEAGVATIDPSTLEDEQRRMKSILDLIKTIKR